jgi:REP element-mobilizing transposase RayT
MRYASDNGRAETLANVVMPDHVHWLLSLGGDITLSRLVGAMKRHSARRINELNRVAGRCVWQRGFHDHALRGDESVPAVARYIVANPLRIRACKQNRGLFSVGRGMAVGVLYKRDVFYRGCKSLLQVNGV